MSNLQNQAITANNSSSIAKINNQSIVVIEHKENKFVAVHPICDALGVDFSGQLQRIKRDEILSSVMVTITTTGADKKQYEMTTLPLKFVFGWLFTIDHNKVKEEKRDSVIKYKLEVYNTLYREFYEKTEFFNEKERSKYKLEAEIEIAKMRVSFLKGEYKDVDNVKFEDWLADKQQLKLNFDTKVEEEAQNV